MFGRIKKLLKLSLSHDGSSAESGEKTSGGILWRSYDDILALLNERTRPVLAFVSDRDGTRSIFLREIFKALPKNEKLRNVLNGPCGAMLLEADSLPEDLAALGAGSQYHIAVLAPAGLTPLVVFNYVTKNPDALAAEIATVLEKLAPHWA